MKFVKKTFAILLSALTLFSGFSFGCGKEPPTPPPSGDGNTITIGTHTIDKDSLINGYTIPLDSMGDNGEYYLDVNSQDVYKKVNSKWRAIGNMDGKPLKKKWDSSRPLKILGIGNSFTEDAFTYLPQVLESLGVTDYRISYLAIGGLDIETNYEHIFYGANSYIFADYVNGGWVYEGNQTFYRGLTCDDWNYISLQQASGWSGISSSYTYLQNIIDVVESIRPDAKILWQMTWAYQQNLSGHPHFPFYNNSQAEMYNAILDTTKTQVLTKPSINFVIPNGTAVQNARTSWLGDTLTRDGYHMSLDVGRYLTALTYAYTTTGIDITGLNFRPAGVTTAVRDMCVESVLNAVKKPFEVTNSTYTEDPYSLDRYTELTDYGWTELGYWNASDPSGKHAQVISGDSISNRFVCTKKFDKSTLPVGSIIEIAEGYTYRPDGWINADPTPGTLRPEKCTTYRIIVDDAWWGDFTTRAFNVSKIDNSSLEGVTAQAKAAFKIYIPKAI